MGGVERLASRVRSRFLLTIMALNSWKSSTTRIELTTNEFKELLCDSTT